MVSSLTVLFRVFSAFMLTMSLMLVAHTPAFAQTGARIDNVASVSYGPDGATTTMPTNVASFVIEGARTESTIEFFRFVGTDDEGVITTRVNGSQFSPSGAVAGPFEDTGDPVTSNGLLLDLSGEVLLAPAERYLAGELVFVRVLDPGQNTAPDIIETLVITLVADTGDAITLRLFESGPDTGAFFAYIPTTREASAPNDAVLGTPGSTGLTATYEDSFDATDISIDTAVIEPFGRVFNSITGELLNGVRVTIIDTATGQPADVVGVDGRSDYPSSVITGTVTTDASGLQYPMGEGEFLFPVLKPGTYQLLVEPDIEMEYPSIWSADDFAALTNAPFIIIYGSFAEQFTVNAVGPRNFDVPVDPVGELIVTKEANTPTTSIGDFVAYTVRIQNQDSDSSTLRIVDTLPRGFRYRDGTARIDGERILDPEISGDGLGLTFLAGGISPGEIRELTYVVLAAAGTPIGEAVNQVVAVNSTGLPISNRAEAAVEVREDLLNSQLTIIGRVAEQACSTDQEWARDIEDGVGVEGVRLYMETGDYVVTDQDGLYHFEGVLPGTHVVQVDTETLPEGYEPVICEETSRYAGSAISQFVDATGGTVWRANFYLERTGEVEIEEAEYEFQDTLEHLDYDQAWLDQQTPDIAWVYPDTHRTPSTLSVNIGIKHAAYDRVQLTLNGASVPGLNFAGSDTSADNRVGISRWRGLDIDRGRNVVKAVITDQFGAIRGEMEKVIWFVDRAERASLVDDQSVLVADGRTNPVISVLLTDSYGRRVHAGRQLNVDVPAPYRLKNTEQFEGEQPIAAALSNQTGVSVGPDGIAHIELAPTLETGRVRVLVNLDNGEQQEIEAFLRPEKRDWIVVGLAEGSLGLERIDGPGAIDRSTLAEDGRIAFFAKGVIRGDWLLTLAVDTAKSRGAADGDIFEGRIDPNAFFTLYGDRTFQDQEAQSRSPVFVKLEKETFQALFGDYDTDLNDTILGRYNRRLTGVKSVYEGERLSFSAFAAETNQGFARDEIAPDGTSGPFILESAPLLRNSEEIFIETRDRFRPDDVLNVRTLTRFVDYDIDFDTGEVIFRLPINVTDEAFNPNVIVAEYETSSAIQRNITAGGRIAGRGFEGRIEVGATYLREEGDGQVPDGVSQLAGVDITAQLDKYTEVHAEYARTFQDATAEELSDPEGDADAFLVEVIRRQEALTISAYFRQDDSGFGLGQQSSATVGARRFGARVSHEFGRESFLTSTFGGKFALNSEAYREENLQTGDSRIVAEANLRRESPFIGSSIGLRSVTEDFESDDEGRRQSLLLTGTINKNFESIGLNVSVAHEQPLGLDESTNFPQRTILGVDKTLTKYATLNARHEILDGENASGNNTVVGVTVQPFTGTSLTAATDLITQDGARRLGATVGVDQVIRINDKWSGAVGLARRANISEDTADDALDVLPDAPISPLETAPLSPLTQTDSFTSGYIGLGYRGERAAASGRLEVRDSALGTRTSVIGGAAREASDVLSYAFASRLEHDNLDDGAGSLRFDARLGASWRPRAKGPVVFNRFDTSYNEVFSQSTNWKVINNLGVNAMINKRTQVSLFHGFKYSRTSFLGDSFDEVTNLVGGEVRFDVTKKIDLGLSASALISQNGQTEYQIGPSVGFTPVDNTWISVGWNVAGFRDNDFEAAEFSRDGPFIKLRVKFDQHTARGLLERISPRGR